ncbi:MAG TPA: hypothetical protein PLU81_06800 [Deltaproteobacteria bacterium]|nr:hypothetical protein [Deltaproteobacteria bacterium]
MRKLLIIRQDEDCITLRRLKAACAKQSREKAIVLYDCKNHQRRAGGIPQQRDNLRGPAPYRFNNDL